jgi:hypothetical protein
MQLVDPTLEQLNPMITYALDHAPADRLEVVLTRIQRCPENRRLLGIWGRASYAFPEDVWHIPRTHKSVNGKLHSFTTYLTRASKIKEVDAWVKERIKRENFSSRIANA